MKRITEKQWADLMQWQQQDVIHRQVILSIGAGYTRQSFSTRGRFANMVFVHDSGLVIDGRLWSYADGLKVRKKDSFKRA